MDNSFTFIDLFSGIGGFRLPLERLGGICLGFSEIDKQAIETYKNNFDCCNECEFGSITSLNELNPKPDLIVGGVPCQSWSIAGKNKGFDDPRGQLWLDAIRVVKLNKPKAFLFENVKGLADPRNRKELNFLLQEFEKVNYKVYWKILNSYDYGLPQNRERIFIVGIQKNLTKDFCFPLPLNQEKYLFEVLDNIEEKKINKSKLSPDKLFANGKIPLSRNRFQKHDELNDFFILSDTRNGHSTIHSWDIYETTTREKQICLTILKNRRKKKYGLSDGNPIPFEELELLISNLKLSELQALIEKKILRFIPEKGFDFVNTKNSSGINGVYRIYLPSSNAFSTLTATGTKDCIATRNIEGFLPEDFRQAFIEEIIKPNFYRPITPREAARLQGFPENFVLPKDEKIAKKQIGNAVSIPVIYAICQNVLKIIKAQNKATLQFAA